MDTTICTKCGEEKPATTEYFHRHQHSTLHTRCKICRNKHAQKYRKENHEKLLAGKKKWRENNPEKSRASSKKWYEENREKSLARVIKWRAANPERWHASQKKYRKENHEKLLAGQKKWREAHPDRVKAWYEDNREKVSARMKKWRAENPHYTRDRKRNDPTYRLHCNLQNGLWRCLSGKQKKSHTLEYVGMDKPELWEYLESKFTDGMTRENYGEWHVDHIRPLCSFDFDQFKEGSEEYENMIHEAWRHTNLQPLWAKDNMSKSGKWEGEL